MSTEEIKNNVGGKIKPSQILSTISGVSGALGTVSGLTGIGVPAAIPLSVISGVSGGVSGLLKLFGAGMTKTDMNKLNKIKKSHENHHSKKKLLTQNDIVNQVKLVEALHLKYKKKGGFMPDGKMKAIGTYQEIWDDLAHHTKSGLITKDKLVLNKKGKVVSKAKSEAGKLRAEKLKEFRFQKKNNDNK